MVLNVVYLVKNEMKNRVQKPPSKRFIGTLPPQGDEWIFRMEMPAVFHKFIVGARAQILELVLLLA